MLPLLAQCFLTVDHPKVSGTEKVAVGNSRKLPKRKK
jgi:hypothetical protein